MARGIRIAGQVFALVGTLLLAFGLDVGTPTVPSVPGITFHGGAGISVLGQPIATVHAEHPWMLSVGLWLVILGVVCGLAAEIAEAWESRRRSPPQSN